MARERIKSDDIDGYQYIVTQLGAVQGKRLATELARAVLPALARLLGDSKLELPKDKGEKDALLTRVLASISAEQVQGALKLALDALPQARLEAIIGVMSDSTDILGPGFGEAGAPMNKNFDEHFAGRYRAMTKWLAFALKVNLPIFSAARRRSGRLFRTSSRVSLDCNRARAPRPVGDALGGGEGRRALGDRGEMVPHRSDERQRVRRPATRGRRRSGEEV